MTLPCVLNGQSLSYKIFLNSEEISLDTTFIYPQNIDSILVDKSTDPSKLLIYTKAKHWESKSLHELIIDSYDHEYDSIFTDNSLFTLFYVKNRRLENIPRIKFDKSYFCEITAKHLSEVEGLTEYCRKIVIIDINLTDKKPEKQVFLRGEEEKSLKELIMNK